MFVPEGSQSAFVQCCCGRMLYIRIFLGNIFRNWTKSILKRTDDILKGCCYQVLVCLGLVVLSRSLCSDHLLLLCYRIQVKEFFSVAECGFRRTLFFNALWNCHRELSSFWGFFLVLEKLNLYSLTLWDNLKLWNTLRCGWELRCCSACFCFSAVWDLLEFCQRKGALTAVKCLGCSLYFKVIIAFVRRIIEFCLTTLFLREIMT